MSIGEKVRLLRVRENFSQRELGEAVGTSYATISKIEADRQRNVAARIVVALAKHFGLAAEDLVNDRLSTSALLAKIEGRGKRPKKGDPETIPLGNLLQIPVVAYVPCGMPTDIPEEMVMGRVSLPYEWVRDREAFAVIARGDSMVGHGIDEGDYVVVSRNLEVQNGSIAVLELNGKVTIKKVFYRDKQVVLQSGNSDYEPIVVTEKDSFRIVGKVVFSGRRHE